MLYTKPVPMMTCAVTASGSQGIAIPPLQMILRPAPLRVPVSKETGHDTRYSWLAAH